jgi:hypothetical protein
VGTAGYLFVAKNIIDGMLKVPEVSKIFFRCPDLYFSSLSISLFPISIFSHSLIVDHPNYASTNSASSHPLIPEVH